MSTFGESLRRERESRRKAIEDVAAATKIGLPYLEALESDEFDALPGPAFGKLYIRAYAEMLGFDPGPLLSAYDAEQKRRAAAAQRPAVQENRGSREITAEERSRARQARVRATMAASPRARDTDPGSPRREATSPEEIRRIRSELARVRSEVGRRSPPPPTASTAEESAQTETEPSRSAGVPRPPTATPRVETASRSTAIRKGKLQPSTKVRIPRKMKKSAAERRVPPTAHRPASSVDAKTESGGSVTVRPEIVEPRAVAARAPRREASSLHYGVSVALLSVVAIAWLYFLVLSPTGTGSQTPRELAGVDPKAAATGTTEPPNDLASPLPPVESDRPQSSALPVTEPETEAALAPEPPTVEQQPPTSDVGALSVSEFGLGRRVVDRRIEGTTDRFREGEVAWFQTRVVGGTTGETIRHVWLREGKVMQSIALRLGGARWRTHSRKTLWGSGSWTVEARDASGRALASKSFRCEPAGS